MALIGAILGDISGSQYEFEECRPLAGIDAQTCELFTDRCVYTDDTIQSLAVKLAVLEHRDFAECYYSLALEYLYVGYGGGFQTWLKSDLLQPFNSCGNGAAMRISFLADHYDDLKTVQRQAEQSAVCTHNHPEGVKGAVAAATCMWMAKHGAKKDDILRYASEVYPLSAYDFGVERPLADYMEYYKFNATCQGSIPVAIRCFIESSDYESCLRNAYRLHCDLDTVCCVGGGIAENFYKGTRLPNEALLKKYLDHRLLDLVYRQK